MKPAFLVVSLFLAIGGITRSEDTKIDFERAKQLFEKQQNGGTLTSEERAYLEEAKRQHEAQRPSGSPPPPPTSSGSDNFDWERAKALHLRAQNGETLSAEEQKHYDEAKRRMQSGQGPRSGGSPGQPPSGDGFDWHRARQIYDKNQRGESLTDEEKKLLDEAMKRRGQGGGGRGERRAELSPDTKPSEAANHLVPLTELTASYHGWDGGLYGGGKNEVPAEHQKLADKLRAQIQPLNAEGKPAADGKIVLMSIGMSNTTNEFSRFVPLANGDSRKATNVIIVDGAQGGQTAQVWSDAEARAWRVAEERMKSAGVTPSQVQVLWIKQANAGPSKGREAEMQRLQDDMQKVVLNAKQKYPNVRIAFLSSRIYAGYAQTQLNPEPYAYEGAFAMRGLIQKQMSGDAALNADAGKAPVLLWGPYLWAAGATPRKSDGLAYLPEDFAGDGTHPSQSGAAKVAKLLLDFFTSDANAKPWFVKK